MPKSIGELVATIQRRENEIRDYVSIYGGKVSGGINITPDYIHLNGAGSSNLKVTISRHVDQDNRYKVFYSDDTGIILSEYMLKFLFLTGLLYSTIWVKFMGEDGSYQNDLRICICCEGVPPVRNYLVEGDTIYYLTDIMMVRLFIKSYRQGKSFDDAVDDTPEIELTTNSPGEEPDDTGDYLTETSGDNEIDGDNIDKDNSDENGDNNEPNNE